MFKGDGGKGRESGAAAVVVVVVVVVVVKGGGGQELRRWVEDRRNSGKTRVCGAVKAISGIIEPFPHKSQE